MDADQFDGIAKALGVGVQRRRVLPLLAGAGTALGALVGTGPFAPPAVARRNDDRLCRNKPAIDNNGCPEAAICRQNRSLQCACARTVGGAKQCVDITNEECPTRDECDRNDDCPGTQVCIQLGGCCDRSPRNLCVRPCGSGGGGGASSSAGEASAPLLGRP
jgi:hypothetical protein